MFAPRSGPMFGGGRGRGWGRFPGLFHSSVASTTAAADGVALPDDMKVMITNSSNPAAYPIASFTWTLANQTQADPVKGKALVDLLNWAATDGQDYSTNLYYAPLPEAAVPKAQALITSIK
jgi:phosphate transport system substrate-binding protein